MKFTLLFFVVVAVVTCVIAGPVPDEHENKDAIESVNLVRKERSPRRQQSSSESSESESGSESEEPGRRGAGTRGGRRGHRGRKTGRYLANIEPVGLPYGGYAYGGGYPYGGGPVLYG